MFFDIFQDLCKTKGVSCKKAAEEIGLSNSITTKWKKTGATPSGDTLDKVAEYFGVTSDFLLGKGFREERTPENTYVPTIIRRIEIRLAEIGMSKADFYKRSGISSASFSQWRNGVYDPSDKKLEDAAACLGVSLDYLKGHSSIEPREEISGLPVCVLGITDLGDGRFCIESLSDDVKLTKQFISNLLSKGFIIRNGEIEGIEYAGLHLHY